MTKPEYQQPAFIENMLLLRRENLDELLDRVAEHGVERCLVCIGLENDSVTRGIHGLRDLLKVWRDACYTA